LFLACAATLMCLAKLILLSHAVDYPTVGLPKWPPFRSHHKPAGALAQDQHPIADFMREANKQWQQYQDNRSLNFRETVAKYRQTYGRHPPPGFKEWYMFARERNAHSTDDFQQIAGDLRPYWAIPPHEIRQMAASLQESEGIAGIRIRNKKIVSQTTGWRVETLMAAIEKIARYLPDMDIAMNTLDQPRVLVPYEKVQEYLRTEATTRHMPADAQDRFTPGMKHLYGEKSELDPSISPEWLGVAGQPYMDFAREACPPDSPARDPNLTTDDADKLYKAPLGGFVTNFNRSSDLCTVGPVLGDQHGFLFSASSNVISRKLVPVFSECKVSVNNDILFPANVYFGNDARFLYNPQHDDEWEAKADSLLWRGATSGGIQVEDNWQRLHRQRLVRMANGTVMGSQAVPILSENSEKQYTLFPDFRPGDFAKKYFDVGFTEAWACIPNCSFYEGVWTYKKPMAFTDLFQAKYLVDVDGHSFSGRWRAFLQSKSLGLKATIFREWHDSRLFPWSHFVPLDNRYHELYALMTYFIGLDTPPSLSQNGSLTRGPSVRGHDFEASVIAAQSRQWAQSVLRDDDLDIYLYLLLLEYGRVLDDNRDSIGYSGDGSELDDFDARHPFPSSVPPLDGG
jgi:hypothetical protein